jgi:hypothetical protein
VTINTAELMKQYADSIEALKKKVKALKEKLKTHQKYLVTERGYRDRVVCIYGFSDKAEAETFMAQHERPNELALWQKDSLTDDYNPQGIHPDPWKQGAKE